MVGPIWYHNLDNLVGAIVFFVKRRYEKKLKGIFYTLKISKRVPNIRHIVAFWGTSIFVGVWIQGCVPIAEKMQLLEM